MITKQLNRIIFLSWIVLQAGCGKFTIPDIHIHQETQPSPPIDGKDKNDKKDENEKISKRLLELEALIQITIADKSCDLDSDCDILGVEPLCPTPHQIYSKKATSPNKLLPLVIEYNRLTADYDRSKLVCAAILWPGGLPKCVNKQCMDAGPRDRICLQVMGYFYNPVTKACAVTTDSCQPTAPLFDKGFLKLTYPEYRAKGCEAPSKRDPNL